MRLTLVGVVVVILALPGVGYAQEAILSGVISDSTGAVVPGVAVSAVHQASGNVFEAVTDVRGGYRLSVRTGDLSPHGGPAGILDAHARRPRAAARPERAW